MELDHSSFLAGVEKMAEDLSLTSAMKDYLLKAAGMFGTDDSIDSLVGADADFNDPNRNDIGPLLKHVGSHSAGGALAGAGLGYGAASASKKDKYKVPAALAGGLVGGITGGVNDLYHLADNSKQKSIESIREEIRKNMDMSGAGEEEISAINDTPWYKVYGF